MSPPAKSEEKRMFLQANFLGTKLEDLDYSFVEVYVSLIPRYHFFYRRVSTCIYALNQLTPYLKNLDF